MFVWGKKKMNNINYIHCFSSLFFCPGSKQNDEFLSILPNFDLTNFWVKYPRLIAQVEINKQFYCFLKQNISPHSNLD